MERTTNLHSKIASKYNQKSQIRNNFAFREGNVCFK